MNPTFCYYRYYLKGPKAGQLETFIDGLPGVPDNISPSANGGYWIGFGLTRDIISDFMCHNPFLRTVIVKVRLANIVILTLDKVTPPNPYASPAYIYFAKLYLHFDLQHFNIKWMRY